MSNGLSSHVKIAKEAGIVLGGKSLSGVLRYLFNILVARSLGVEILGMYSIANSVTSITSVIGKLGLDNGILRFVSRMLAQNRHPKVIATVRKALKIGILSSFLCTFGLLISSPWLSRDLFHNLDPLQTSLLIGFSLSVPMLVFAHICAFSSQAFKILKYKVLSLDIVPSLTMLIIFMSLVYWTTPIWALTASYVGAQLLSVIFAGISLKRIIPFHQKTDDTSEPGLLSFSLPLLLTSVFAFLLHWSDIIMLGVLTDAHVTGLYQPAVRTAGLMSQITVGLVAIFGPLASGLYAEDKLQEIHRLLKLVGKWSISLAWPGVLFLLLYAPKVMLLFGGTFIPSSPTLRLLALGQIALAFSAGSGILLVMTGYPALNMANSIITLIVNIVANLYLIPRYGGFGAAAATTISMFLLAILRTGEIWFLHRMHPVGWGYVKPIAAGVIATLVSLLIRPIIFDFHTVIVLLLATITFSTVYLGALYMFRFDEDDQAVFAALKRKIKRGT